MRNVSRVVMAVALLLWSTFLVIIDGRDAMTATFQLGELAPTPLEAFADRPGAVLVWSRPIGQLDSPIARATFTAVAFEEPTSRPPIMRGLRIDLAHLQPNPDCDLRFTSHRILCARPNAAILFEEASLPRVRAGVERGNAEQNLIISFRTGRSGNEIVGLIIGGYTFDHWRREHLIAVVDNAIAELKNAPQ